MADISKITLPSGSTYNIKDATARNAIEKLTAGGITYKKVDTLPTASKDTLGNIYLVPHTHGTNDACDEYITIAGGTAQAPTYAWEKIGSTDIDLNGYAQKGDGVSVTTGTAANKKTGITIANHTVTQGDVSASGNFTPEGTNKASNVTITASTTDVYSMTSAGSKTDGKAASFTQGTDTFTPGTLAALSTTVANETLTIGWTAPTASTFTQGTDSFTPNTPTAVTLPGRSSVIKAWTGYSAATAAAQVFTGTEASVSVSGKTTGVAVSAHSITDNGHTHTVTGSGTIDS